jgi:hypothetical protein
MTVPSITPHTSAQIAILRPLCIFFMFYVHVNPGFDPAIHSGAMLYLGTLVVDILGRTSVAALSLVSGFLVAYGATRKNVGTLIWGRIRTLYLPMLVWSAIFIAMALGGSILLGHTTGASRVLENLPLDRLIAEKLMFLYGTPASEALGFLRDLTASSILLILLLRIPGQAVIWCAMLAVFGIVLFGTMAPVVYRPTIPLFMLAGAAFYRGRGNLDIPLIYAICAAFLFAVLLIYTLSGLATANSNPAIAFGTSAVNVAKRAILTILALTLGSVLVTTRTGTWLRGISDSVFLAYLCHTTVISILWAVWKREVGNEAHWSYLIFFALSPILVMAIAIRMGSLLDRLPRPIQIGIRGKVRVPASRYTVRVKGSQNV